MRSFSAAAAMKLSGTVVARLALPLASRMLPMMPGEPKTLVAVMFRTSRVLLKNAADGNPSSKVVPHRPNEFDQARQRHLTEKQHD